MAPSKSHWLADPARAGVFHLTADARQTAEAAAAAGLAAYRIDIGRAHDQAEFMEGVSQALLFPGWFGHNWDALADCLKDLSWLDTKDKTVGFVLVLEKSKHFAAAHRHEFELAMDLLAETADYWRGEGRAFWALIGGPEGWKSGYPGMPEL